MKTWKNMGDFNAKTEGREESVVGPMDWASEICEDRN